MRGRRIRAWLVLGVVFLMIRGRWAAAAVDASAGTETEVPPRVENSTPPDLPSVVRAERLLRAGGPDFYYAIWRDDLAERTRRRHGLKLASRVVGAAVVTVGGVWWFALEMGDALGCSGLGASPPCQRPWFHWGPALLIGGGLVPLLAPIFVHDDPLRPEERGALLRDFVARKRAIRVSIAPRFDREGGSLALVGAF
jgi:hypothetical protein